MSIFKRFFSADSEASESNQEEGDEEERVSITSSTFNDGTSPSLDEQSNSTTISQHEPDEKSAQDNPLLPEELCELPSFFSTKNCDKTLVDETRRMLKKKYLKRPGSFHPDDYERMLADDWTVSRFLLRCRLQPKRAAKLMEQCGKFRREYRMGVSKLSDFPIEFHRAGGLFRYAPDRVGNQTLYMRVKMHRRVPELSQIMREFILCCLEECDKANNGRGTAVIFDLTNCGLQNVDPGFLFWLVYSFRNYCPKGLSYIIIYNLPWILNATAKLALSWLSSTNRKRLRFVSGEGIKDFIASENLPDYMGGTCKIDYRAVPKGARLAEETAEEYKLTREQSRKLREVYEKFLKEMDGEVQLIPENLDQATAEETTNNSGTEKSEARPVTPS